MSRWISSPLPLPLTLLLLAAADLPVAAQTRLTQVPASLEIPDHPPIERYTARYLSSPWQPWLQRMVDHSAFYASYILGQLEQRGMPAELLFLPAIESAYSSAATSFMGAAGLWQIMPATARLHGLVIGELIDERRDFWKATDVALRILQANYDELGSWELALAAYNAGLGRVRRAVRAGATTNYWELSRRGLLPRETREFVPRFYGLLSALRAADAAALPAADALVQWRQLEAPGGIDLTLLGGLAEVPVALLEQANAELRYGLTPPSRETHPYRLKVPAATYDRIVNVLQDASNGLVRLHWHVIRSGDTMSELAEAFRVSVALIRQYNGGMDPRRMPIGVGLRIPLVRGVDPATVFLAPPATDRREFDASYQVAGGDSLWGIARLHDTTVEALAHANGLQTTSTLQPGQLLRVPRTGSA